jgi:type IV pilus assembly protein PilY1
MRTVRISTILYFILILLFCLPSLALADDNEIFGVVQETLEPNILLIIDNSGSMDSEMEIEGECWEECVDWECPGTWECQREACTGFLWRGNCYFGHWECVDWECCMDGNCSPENLVCSQYEENCEIEVTTRMAVAKETTKNIIEQYGGQNRFGIMTFHYDEGGYIPSYDGRVATCSVKDEFILDENGEKKTGTAYDDAIEDYKAYLKDIVDDLDANGSTPLAETLFEAGRYFAGEASVFNSDSSYYPYNGNYPDKEAIGYRCRKNYTVLMTDGQPQRDNDRIRGRTINGNIVPVSNDYPNEGTDSYRYFYDAEDPELPDVAGLLFDNDINGHFDEPDYNQNVITYTIGFSEGVSEKAQEMLQDTADKGLGAGDTPYEDDGGLFFYATGQQDLARAFETIMFNISEKATTFSAPTVPISEVNKAYSGDYVYMSMFQPQSGQTRWIGNLKKYYLNDDLEFASCDDHTPILHENGQTKDTATSCWTSPMNDGGSVNMGGAGQILTNTPDANRNIYSNITGSYLTSSDNAFSTNNNSLTPSHFGFATEGAKDTLINNVRMVNEAWKLGDLNHSRPAVATYTSGGTVDQYILVGSNDGMLHCFDDSDGTEAWAFVPSQQFTRLEEAYTGDHSYFMDGSPTVANTSSKKVVICGERRGGNKYYALDISSINSPEYLYTYSTSGQSWSQPQFMKVASGTSSTEEVFLITGGYDVYYDVDNPPDDPDGDSIIMIDAESGSEHLRFDSSDLSAMEHSIVYATASDTVDDNEDIVNQIYAGDLGGNVFAFRDNNDADDPKALDGSWQSLHLFTAESSGKKIFHGSASVREYIDYWNSTEEDWQTVVGDYVFFGTGDRANPLRKDKTNYFYCVKNDWITEDITVSKSVDQFATLNDTTVTDDNSELVMLDVSDNDIQDGTEEEQRAVREALNKKYNRGWYFELENPGEKCLSAPVVYGGVVYFTTFTPDDGSGDTGDPCVNPSGGGTARLYAINYKTGGAVYDDFDGDNPDDEIEDDLGKDDRSKVIDIEDVTIAPDPLTIISEKGEKLSVGPGTEDLMSKAGVHMFYWIQE